MNAQGQRIGVPAITENLLKRKWSAVILRHLEHGMTDPTEIAKVETGITPKVMSERLRTMVRYGLIRRHSRPAPSDVIEYHLTALGQKILKMIDCINQLDSQLRQGMFANRKRADETHADPSADSLSSCAVSTQGSDKDSPLL